MAGARFISSLYQAHNRVHHLFVSDFKNSKAISSTSVFVFPRGHCCAIEAASPPPLKRFPLRVDAPGFTRKVIRNITLEFNENVAVNFILWLKRSDYKIEFSSVLK